MRTRLTTLRTHAVTALRVASSRVALPSLRPGGFCRVVVVVASALVMAACRQDMHDTPRYETFEANPNMPDGRASRAYPAGTVARGQLRDDDHFYTGKVNGEYVAEFPFAIAAADLARGQERFTAYCTPCHGQLGDGKGMVVQRGLRQAATYHQDRLREAAPGYLYDVISNGFGAMQGYAEQVPPRDRWLIAAYVRALQLSQNARVDDVPAADRGKLDAPAPSHTAAAETAPATRAEH